MILQVAGVIFFEIFNCRVAQGGAPLRECVNVGEHKSHDELVFVGDIIELVPGIITHL